MASSTETTVAHTPGPWRRDSGYYPQSAKVEEFSPYIVDSDGRNVAAAMMIVESEQQFLANARLIAAAPELLDALERLMAVQNGAPLHKYEREWDAAIVASVSAIAKATGIMDSKRNSNG